MTMIGYAAAVWLGLNALLVLVALAGPSISHSTRTRRQASTLTDARLPGSTAPEQSGGLRLPHRG